MFKPRRFICLVVSVVALARIVSAQELRVARPAVLGAATYRGDANGNGTVEPDDIFFIINYLVGGGPEPDQICLADADSNQGLTLADAHYLANYFFGEGPEPAFSVEVCNGLDDDCNGIIDDGFRNPSTGLYDQDHSCGSCSTNCIAMFDVANASGSCVVAGTPQCVMNCDAGAFNLNGFAYDGCEFVLDGDAVYISRDDPAATDDGTCGLGPVSTGPGNHPCRTIAFGVARAIALNRTKILVADGNYDESVTLPNGRELLGGYRADTWERHLSTTSTVIRGVSSDGNHDRTVVASDITELTVLEGFVIRGSLNTKTSGNSYAIYVADSTANLEIRNNIIEAGRGGAGAAGFGGNSGANGPNGGGSTGPTDAAYSAKIATGADFCNSTNNRQIANGAPQTCLGADSVAGGNGGGNRCSPSSTLTEFSGIDGVNGQPGAGASGGAAGGGGDAGDDMRLESNGAICVVPTAATFGADGTSGQSGAHGASATGCSSSGTVEGGHWMARSGTPGNAGGNGGGGGGGGAGGGAYCLSCSENKDRLGGHGGGGGAGGCGGCGGTEGTGGGGVFGIFVSGGAAPAVTNNIIVLGEGGSGGSGGHGGAGGLGGVGGDGGHDAVFCTGKGGRGGDGGDGGHGSGGGGGCGGSSFGIYISNAGAFTSCAANAISGGSGGPGGPGGLSLVNGGQAGQPGTAVPCSVN